MGGLKMTGEDSGLDSHLERAALEGALVDEGSITLHPEKALEKLAKFSLPESGFWVLKLVQAAVAAKAPAIEFKFLRKRVEIVFANVAGWRAGQILDFLSRGAISQDRALAHLQTAFAAALGDGNDSVTWSCGQQHCVLSFEGVSCEPSDPSEEVRISARRSRSRLSFAAKLTKPLRHVVRQTVFEYKAIIDRTLRCPIPISIDGRELPRRYGALKPELRTGTACTVEPISPLAVKAIQGCEGLGRLPFPMNCAETICTEEKDSFSTIEFPAGPGPVQGVLSLYVSTNSVWELIYLHDGVELEFEPVLSDVDHPKLMKALARATQLNQDSSARVYVNFCLCVEVLAEDIDISHFAVGKERYRLVVEGLAPEIRMMLKAVRDECLKPWNFPSQPATRPVGWEDFSIADIGVCFPAAVMFLGVAVVATPLVGVGLSLVAVRDALTGPPVDPRGAMLEKALGVVLHALDELV
jgi:hypothetical protein